MNPVVTIISLYHNRENYVDDSVLSLVNQTYRDLRIVLVDDCSTDATYERLKAHSQRDNRVLSIRNEVNKGFTATLIETIRNYGTEYIAIHGSGDISAPTRIEEQIKCLTDNPEIGVLGTGTSQKNKMDAVSSKLIDVTLQDLLKKNRITHGSVMFKLSIYNSAGGYRSYFTSRQDKDLWYRMIFKCRVAVLDKALYSSTEVPNSISKTASKTSIPTMLSSFATYLVKQRIINGIDSLDLHGDKAALFFNPAYSNNLYFTNIWRSIKKRNWESADSYAATIISINTNPIIVGGLKIFRLILKMLKK